MIFALDDVSPPLANHQTGITTQIPKTPQTGQARKFRLLPVNHGSTSYGTDVVYSSRRRASRWLARNPLVLNASTVYFDAQRGGKDAEKPKVQTVVAYLKAIRPARRRLQRRTRELKVWQISLSVESHGGEKNSSVILN
jgi:hypothetical protein